MTIDIGALDASLAAAVGSDPGLIAELRKAFLESAWRQLDLLRRSRCDANWQFTALRLKGLAASFDHRSIMELADEAADAAPGDPLILKKLSQALELAEPQ